MSTPGHRSHGAHMDRDEINAILNPVDESVMSVLGWLKSFGIIGVHDNQWIKADVTVSQVQELLQTQYNVYLNPVSSKTIVRTLSYSLPNNLIDHVDLVQPTTFFGMEPQIPNIKNMAAEPSMNKRDVPTSSCDSTVTPACIRSLYNITYGYGQAKAVARLGVAGFREHFANRADLTTFLQTFQSDADTSGSSVELINGGTNPQGTNDATQQANLNVQYSVALAFPVDVTFYSVGGHAEQIGQDGKVVPEQLSTNEPFLELIQYFLDMPDGKPPHTLVLPYSDQEISVPRPYAEKVCNMFGMLAGRGVSIIAPSGDDGVGTYPCTSNNGENKFELQTTFPASCPWVTSVGGTTGISPEVAASSSGGGFSKYFTAPDWQTSAVATFFGGLGTNFDGQFNKAGRAVPDVATQSRNFQIVVGGQIVTFEGTSCSATVFGAVISLLNDQRLRMGKSPLGWLNKALYSSGSSAFNDITSGSNPGCGTPGFSAGEGWDPVTGLGTPDFPKLLDWAKLEN
ncbi:hypothetical protein BGZ75_000719 [Mortierella antarctica]|nr:hypothetical protein BGZ75_000719 [Mortierella antarctica]